MFSFTYILTLLIMYSFYLLLHLQTYILKNFFISLLLLSLLIHLLAYISTRLSIYLLIYLHIY